MLFYVRQSEVMLGQVMKGWSKLLQGMTLGNLMRDLDTLDHVRPVWVRSGPVISG